MGFIRTVILDIDKCVYPPIPAIHNAHRTFFINQVQQALGIPAWDEAEHALDRGIREFGTNTRYLQSLCVGGGDLFTILKLQEESVWQVRHDHLQKDERLLNMLVGLHFAGIRLFTLRNGTIEGTRMILNRLFGNYCEMPANGSFKEHEVAVSQENLCRPVFPFDGLGVTAELKTLKPDPAVFARLIEEHGINPSETIMAGDTEHVDLEPAKRHFGMETVLVTWSEGIRPRGGCVDHVIGQIYELADIIC